MADVALAVTLVAGGSSTRSHVARQLAAGCGVDVP